MCINRLVFMRPSGRTRFRENAGPARRLPLVCVLTKAATPGRTGA